MRQIWKSVQLFVAFHKDQDGKPRSSPFLWAPKRAQANVTDPAEKNKEAVLIVDGTEEARDVQVAVRPDQIVLRRDDGENWRGLVVTDHTVTVQVGGCFIEIQHDGAVRVTDDTDQNATILGADGSIYRWTAHGEIRVSGDGSQVTRRSAAGLAAITADGVIAKNLG